MEVAGSSEALAVARGKPELLTLVRDELIAEAKQRLSADAQHACEQVDRLTFSTLRQLPPHIRAMSVREAFQLACDKKHPELEDIGGASCDRKKRQDAHTQTNPCSSKSKRQKPEARRFEGIAALESSIVALHSGPSLEGAVMPLCSSMAGVNIGSPPPVAAKVQGASALVQPDSVALRMQELQHKTQAAEELTRLLGEASGRLHSMPGEQRRSFMSRVNSIHEKMFVQPAVTRPDAGGA